VKLQVNRLVSWIWIGGVLLTLGTGLTVLPERRTAPAAVAARALA
jgi:cytochrome c biogenesis factor